MAIVALPFVIQDCMQVIWLALLGGGKPLNLALNGKESFLQR
jgi:hypothetical protein